MHRVSRGGGYFTVHVRDDFIRTKIFLIENQFAGVTSPLVLCSTENEGSNASTASPRNVRDPWPSRKLASALWEMHSVAFCLAGATEHKSALLLFSPDITRETSLQPWGGGRRGAGPQQRNAGVDV